MSQEDIIKKYARFVTDEQARMMASIMFAYGVMSQNRVSMEALDRSEADSHSFMHITNPTLYRDMLASETFRRNLRVVRAALTFIREIDAVNAELPEKPLVLNEKRRQRADDDGVDYESS